MILTATGEEYKAINTRALVVTADGEAYKPPAEPLARDEFEIIEQALQINRRTGKPTRNCYRPKKLSPDLAAVTAALLEDMAKRGLVKLFVEPKSPSGLRKIKKGDMSGGRVVATVQQKGFEAFLETIRQAHAIVAAAKAAQ